MKSKLSLSALCGAEIYKVFHNRIIVSCLLSPLLVYLLALIYMLYKGRSGLFGYEMPQYVGNPWMTIWSRHSFPFLSLMLPLVVTVVSYLLCEIEFQNDNIRSLFSLPVTKWKLYLSKVLVLFFLIVIVSVITWAGFILGGYLLGFLMPAYPFAEYAVWLPSLQILSRILLASFCVGMIELVFSLFSRNFTLPVISCILLTGIAIFVTNEPIGSYLPFATYTYIGSVRPIEELMGYDMRDIANLILLGGGMVLGYIYFTPEKRRLLS